MNTPQLPEGFDDAYEGLVGLVGRLETTGVPEGLVGEQVDAWRSEDCRGSQTLAMAAALAFKYQLSSTGLAKDDPQTVTGRMEALSQVEEVLDPSRGQEEKEGQQDPPIVEVALPEAMRQAAPQARGFKMGKLQIIFEPAQDPPYVHLSVSHPHRYPLWEELLRARTALEGPAPNLFAWVPKPEETRSTNPKTVHLYVVPPRELIG